MKLADKSNYITVVNGKGERAEIPRAGLEEYKRMMAKFTEMAKTSGSSEATLKAFEIVSIEE